MLVVEFVFDVRPTEQFVVCPRHGIGMPEIGRIDNAVFKGLKHLFACLRIGVPRTVGGGLKCVKIEPLDVVVSAAIVSQTVNRQLGIGHMDGIVAVVGNHHYS